MASTEPTWRLVLDAARRLGSGGRSFTREALLREVQRMDPGRGDGTIGPTLQGMTVNASGGPPSPCGTPLRRVERGVYRLVDPAREPGTSTPSPPRVTPRPSPSTQPAMTTTSRRSVVGADVVLVGCVKTKLPHAAPARDLYTSPLFRGRRRYAELTRRPWFIVSARWGLLAPEEVVATYDMYLGDQPPAYRWAWAEFVVAQLQSAMGPLNGLTVELHAGADYRSALEDLLRAHGAIPVNPVPSGGLGEILSWYAHSTETSPARGEDLNPNDTDDAGTEDPAEDRAGDEDDQPAERVGMGRPMAESSAGDPSPEHLVSLLTDSARRLRPEQLLDTHRRTLAAPGLYSWWVDDAGAADLTAGADLPIEPGLIYAGLAGATRWPSGKRSTNTLWSRLTGMHLGGRAEFSTFRRTLAALLRTSLSLTSEDDPSLSTWIRDHLQVTPVVVEDADALGRLEESVLQPLDPPLNLQGMTPTPLRARIKDLRHDRRG
jgi:hypothetical protein